MNMQCECKWIALNVGIELISVEVWMYQNFFFRSFIQQRLMIRCVHFIGTEHSSKYGCKWTSEWSADARLHSLEWNQINGNFQWCFMNGKRYLILMLCNRLFKVWFSMQRKKCNQFLFWYISLFYFIFVFFFDLFVSSQNLCTLQW